MPDDEDDVEGDVESVISFKKIVKIMNLCQVYVPIIQ
jgi:hypothetical protein